MKKIILILTMFLFVAFTANAQRTLTADTLMAVETINFASMPGAKTVGVVCTQLGGTSDGTLTLYASTDNTNWKFLNFIGSTLGIVSPQASLTGSDLNQLTITSGLAASWVILNDHYAYYRITAVGTANDTTRVVVTWSKK